MSFPVQGVCKSLKRVGGSWYGFAVDGDKFVCLGCLRAPPSPIYFYKAPVRMFHFSIQICDGNTCAQMLYPSARKCYIHLCAGVIDICAQVYMTPARRCYRYLHAYSTHMFMIITCSAGACHMYWKDDNHFDAS